MNTSGNQEAFNKIIAHLVKQGRKAGREYIYGSNDNPADKQFQCMYRDPQGGMCAVGCLIPDELYRPTLESLPVASLLAANYELDSHFRSLKIDRLFLMDIQIDHDNIDPNVPFVPAFLEKAKETAAEWKLTMPDLGDLS